MFLCTCIFQHQEITSARCWKQPLLCVFVYLLCLQYKFLDRKGYWKKKKDYLKETCTLQEIGDTGVSPPLFFSYPAWRRRFRQLKPMQSIWKAYAKANCHRFLSAPGLIVTRGEWKVKILKTGRTCVGQVCPIFKMSQTLHKPLFYQYLS